jgi:hypothetical protein
MLAMLAIPLPEIELGFNFFSYARRFVREIQLFAS